MRAAGVAVGRAARMAVLVTVGGWLPWSGVLTLCAVWIAAAGVADAWQGERIARQARSVLQNRGYATSSEPVTRADKIDIDAPTTVSAIVTESGRVGLLVRYADGTTRTVMPDDMQEDA